MARIEGLDPKQAPVSMRFIFRMVRNMTGRDLTPLKIGARVPRVFWFHAIANWLLFGKPGVPHRQLTIVTLRTAARVGCPF